MTRAVFGFCMYGVGDPFNNIAGSESPALVLYTNGELPPTGLPAELTVLGVPPVVRPIVSGLPGINFGASPRTPVGSGGTTNIRLMDDDTGSLGKLFLTDDNAEFWLLQEDKLSAAETILTVKGNNSPPQQVYYIGNEAIFQEIINVSNTQTWEMEVTRGYYGSIAQVRTLAPRDYSPGETGAGDAVLITKKPNWDNGFYCGLYLFILDENGAYVRHILRRGVVIGEPTPKERPYYDISVKMLEDVLADHQIGEESRAVSLSRKIVVDEADIGSDGGFPLQATLRLTREEAETFFNECLHDPGTTVIVPALVTDLKARLFQDPDIHPQIVIEDGDTWIFDLIDIRLLTYGSNVNSNYIQYISIKLSLVTNSDGASILGS
jgi:hypothetical protein